MGKQYRGAGIIAAALTGVLVCGLTTAKPAAEADSDEFVFPVLRIPQMAVPPVLDGKVDAAEWAGAAEFTGFSGNPLGKPFLLPEAQQPVWLMGFNGKMLYLAMRSPHPKGTYPVGRVKDNDNPDVLWGDHVEIQFLTNAREDAGKPGKGFYKMVINAWGANWDSHYFNGTPGTEDIWNGGGTVKCQVTDELWEMELSVAAPNLKLPALEGNRMVVQLVRAADTGGIYYAGWTGGSWMEWPRFAEVVFEAAAPVVQFTHLGEVMAGAVDLELAVTGTGPKPQDVEAVLTVEDAAGKVICQETQSVRAAKSERKVMNFKKTGLPVSEVDIDGGRNQFELKAVWKDGKTEKVLYRNRSPFMKMTPAWRTKYWDPWIAGRPQSGAWDTVFAYLPYARQGRAKVDVDFFGTPDRILGARDFAVEVRKKGETAILAKGAGQLRNRAGEILFAVPELADGAYEAVFHLNGADGKPAGDKTVPFTRRHFPFEHNTLGLADEVIPPFLPLQVNPVPSVLAGGGPRVKYSLGKLAGDWIFAWGRAYRLGTLGLPAQIVATPPTGTAGRPEELLAAPVRLELTSGKKLLPLTGETARIVKAEKHRVEVAASAQAGAVNLGINAVEEYDGWYEVTVELSGPEKGTPPPSIEAFDLVMDLRDCAGDRSNPVFPVDTLYVQRMGGGIDNSYQGEIPRQPGVHFRSLNLGSTTMRTGPADVVKDWKSFAPITFAGNGDRGLWFFAWSDAGWVLKDGDPMLQVERLKDGNVRLRVRLISGPVTLEQPRKLRFALQGAPIKANDPEYRTRLGRIAHDTSGYRYYGDSVDSFALHTDEDFRELRKFLLYGTTLQTEPDPRYNHWSGVIGKKLRDGTADRVMLYGSQWMTGMGAEEFDAFGGEWLGDSSWKPAPDLKFSGKKNYGGTVQWQTPRQLSAIRVNWPQSMVDFFVWYHEKLINRVGFNGTWWDNCYSGTITDYDPELERMDAKWNLYMRRQLCKRLNVIGWEHLRPPCWSMNSQVEMSWCQVYWLVEGFWGPSAKDISTIDHFGSLGFFRSALRPKSVCLTPSTSYMTHYRGSTPESDRKMMRSSDGILLLHDVAPVFDQELVRKLEYTVDYSRTNACFFLGYWAAGAFIQPAAEGLVVSVYQNPARRAAVLLFFNPQKKDQYLGGTTFNPAGVLLTASCVPAEAERAVTVSRVYDLETGRPVKTGFREGRLLFDEPLVLGGHEFRAIAVEAAE